MKRLRGRRRWLGLALGLIAFLVIDYAIFRSGWYFQYVAPESQAGATRRAIDAATMKSIDQRPVVLLGNSKVGEGFSAPIAAESAAREGRPDLTFVNAAVPGSDVKVWYYILKKVDPNADRFSAVVLATDNYGDDVTNYGDMIDYQLKDVQSTLGWGGAIDFLRTTDTWTDFFKALRILIVAAPNFATDIWDFAHQPFKRLRDLAWWKTNAAVEFYQGRDESLSGVKYDAVSRTVTAPASMPALTTKSIDAYAASLGTLIETPETARYKAFWYGRIADRYRAHGIPVFVFRLPRGPLHYTLGTDGRLGSALASLQETGRIDTLRPDLLTDIERPEYFFDHLHVNAAGRKIMSARLGSEIAQRLGPPKPQASGGSGTPTMRN